VDPSMVVATDSAKMAHYVPGTTGVRRVWFGTTDECLDAAVTGRWAGRLV
jgi:predicted aconitase